MIGGVESGVRYCGGGIVGGGVVDVSGDDGGV